MIRMGQRNPNHQFIGGFYPTIYRLETTIPGGVGFRNHPQYVPFHYLSRAGNTNHHEPMFMPTSITIIAS